MSRLPILQVEDDEHDVFFLRRAFEEAGIPNPLQVVYDGQEAIDYFAGTGKFADRARYPLPCLVVLDLKLPRKNGLEVLEWLRNGRHLPRMPVIMFSSSAHPEDVNASYCLGANSFVVKPAGVAERTQFARALKDYWLHFNEPSPLLREHALTAGLRANG
jgi:CheY-like chemotaxis protein